MSAARPLAAICAAAATAGAIAAASMSVGVSAAFPEWTPQPAPRHPRAAEAESLFFLALNHDASLRQAAIDALTEAVAADPADGATNLWLGLAHLWVLAEDGGEAWTLLDDAILARHFLSRAASLRPEDTRIPSWLCAAELVIADLERDAPAAAAAHAALARAYADDPTFHAVSVGILRWNAPRDSDAFAEGLAAMRSALVGDPDDPSALNAPRWPHNVEGFLLAMADYELKAGNRQRAAAMLTAARERPGYDSWPYRHLAEERLADLHGRARRLADADPANDPPFILGRAGGVACVVCHRAADPR